MLTPEFRNIVISAVSHNVGTHTLSTQQEELIAFMTNVDGKFDEEMSQEAAMIELTTRILNKAEKLGLNDAQYLEVHTYVTFKGGFDEAVGALKTAKDLIERLKKNDKP